MSRPLRVAIVAPSLAILGGQSVQAMQLAQGWANDPEVQAWLVPINPPPPGPFIARRPEIRPHAADPGGLLAALVESSARGRGSRLLGVLYVVRARAAAGGPRRRALGRPGVLNYRSGEAPDHLRRSRLACRTLRQCRSAGVPSRVPVRGVRLFGITGRHPQHRRREASGSAPAGVSGPVLLHPQPRDPLQRRVHAPGLSPRANGGARCVAHGRGAAAQGCQACGPGRLTGSDRGEVRRPGPAAGNPALLR